MINTHCFVNLSPVAFLERSGAVYKDRAALMVNEKVMTYGAFLARSRKMAELLRVMGVGLGDRVGVLSLNSTQVLEAHFAIPGSGGVIVNLNPWLPYADTVNQIQYSNISVLLSSCSLYESCRPLFDMLGPDVKVIVLDAAFSAYAESFINCESLLPEMKGDIPLDQFIRSENDPIAINFTSGTTGRPKGVVYSHRAAYLHALGQVMMLQLTAGSRYLWTVPMFHVNGWGHMWASAAVGARQYVETGSMDLLPAQLHEIIRHHRISHLAGAPRLVKKIVQDVPDPTNLSGLTIVTGGAAPTPDLIYSADDLGVKLIHQYGLNETCGPFVVCEEQEQWDELDEDILIERKLRQGVAAIHVGRGLRVVDDKDNDVPHDGQTQGEILMAGNTVATEYFNDPESTKKAFRNGWFRSGDMAVVHADGYLEIKDRIKDLIFVNTEYGWENISSIEIERIISRCEGVSDVAVIGVSLGDSDTKIIAYFEREKGSSIDYISLRAFCKETLPSYKIPNYFWEQTLPKTATGKIKKHELERKAVATLVTRKASSLESEQGAEI